MFAQPPCLTKPGLFVTATDTGVGKTAITCAIAWTLRRQMPGWRVGVCKPLASGCRRDREGLVSADAEALAHFADCRQLLSVINPVCYAPPVAPAVAAELTGRPVDFAAIARSLEVLDQASDCLLVEGVGGLLTPVDGAAPRCTVLDLVAALGYPVVVVTRAGLGTLSHTALTVRGLQAARCHVAGMVINGYEPDSSAKNDRATDISMTTNRQWLAKMNNVPILATVPACPSAEVAPQKGQLPQEILAAVGLTYWPEVLGRR